MNEPETGIEGTEPDEFEQQLTRALRPVDPPPGFAARVMERAARPQWRALPARAWAPGAIAALLALGLLLAGQVHARHKHQEAALSQQEFETAMRVTDHALEQTRAQLQRAGLNLGN